MLPIKQRPQHAELVLEALQQGRALSVDDPRSTVVTRGVSGYSDAGPLVAASEKGLHQNSPTFLQLNDQPKSTPEKALDIPTKKGRAFKAVGVIAVLLALGVGGMWIGSDDFKNVLSSNAEEEQRLFDAAVQLEGEVKYMDEKLNERPVYESAKLTELKGLLILGSRQIQDKSYKQAQATLEKAKPRYRQLLEEAQAGADIPSVKDQVREAMKKYEDAITGYALTESAELYEARSKENDAQKAESSGELVEALDLYRKAALSWTQALDQVRPEIVQIDKQRAAAAVEQERLAVEEAEQRRRVAKAQPKQRRQPI